MLPPAMQPSTDVLLATQPSEAAADADPSAACSTAAVLSQALTLLLQSEQHSCVQDAATFSRLICVSHQLSDVLLHAAVGCLRLHVPRYTRHHHMLDWLTRHLQLGTLKHLDIEADECCPEVYASLAQQLSTLFPAAAFAAAKQSKVVGSLDSSSSSSSSGDAEAETAPPPAAAAATVEKGCSSLETAEAAAATAATATAGAVLKAAARPRRLPLLTVSWHVCGLPSALCQLPGATLTHLTLRDRTVSTATLQQLSALTTLQQLHLPNLSPGPASLAPALLALSRLTQLFIRHPCPSAQQALPVSLQQLVVAPRMPPWGNAAPELGPLRLAHLAALTSLTVHEWFAQGITEQCTLPHSLQHLAVVCIASAAPLKPLKQLHTLQLSSLRHSDPGQLLQLSTLPALTTLQLGSELPSADTRLSYAELRTYLHIFQSLPVFIAALRVQQTADGFSYAPARRDLLNGDCPAEKGLCEQSFKALCSIQGLTSLRLEGRCQQQLQHRSLAAGQHRQQPSTQAVQGAAAVCAMQKAVGDSAAAPGAASDAAGAAADGFIAALSALPGLAQLRVCGQQVVGAEPSYTSSGSSSSDSSGSARSSSDDTSTTGCSAEGSAGSSLRGRTRSDDCSSMNSLLKAATTGPTTTLGAASSSDVSDCATSSLIQTSSTASSSAGCSNGSSSGATSAASSTSSSGSDELDSAFSSRAVPLLPLL